MRKTRVKKNDSTIDVLCNDTVAVNGAESYSDENCLIFCGEVREVLGWLRDAGIFVDCIVTSPPFYGQRDYGVSGQIGLEQKPEGAQPSGIAESAQMTP